MKYIITLLSLLISGCQSTHVYLNKGEDGQLGQQKEYDLETELRQRVEIDTQVEVDE